MTFSLDGRQVPLAAIFRAYFIDRRMKAVVARLAGEHSVDVRIDEPMQILNQTSQPLYVAGRQLGINLPDPAAHLCQLTQLLAFPAGQASALQWLLGHMPLLPTAAGFSIIVTPVDAAFQRGNG